MTPKTSRHILPSIPAAIAAGAVAMPIFALGWRYINAGHLHPLAQPAWGLIGFVLPIMLATVDFRYLARTSETFGDYLKPRYSAEDFRELYIPAWLRMTVCFLSAVISMGILRLFGVEF